MPHFNPSFRPSQSRQILAALLTFSAAAAIAGCASPMDISPGDRAWGNYTDALITHEIVNGTYDIPVADPTINNGVRQMARVDQTDLQGVRVSALVSIDTASPSAPDAAASQPASGEPQMTTTPETFGQPEATHALTLEDAIARAMKHSLAIQVEAYNPAIKETQITQALAVFDPVLFGQSQWTRANDPISQLGINANGDTWSNQVGIRQLLPSGGTVQGTVGDTYHDFQDSSAFAFNPSHQIGLGLQLTQPLLKGFGDNVTRANIYLAQRDKRIALSTFRRQVIDSVSKVEEAYHTLWQAQEALVIQEDLLQKTLESYNKTVLREMDKTVITVKQAQAAFEQRQAELIRGRAAVRNASDNLKALINDPELDIRSNTLIIAADKGIEIPIAFSVSQQVDMALRQRGELQEARIQIERADIVINSARNSLLPKFDLTLSATANGLESGFDEAFHNTVDSSQSNVDWLVGAKFEVPLGNRADQAVLRQHQLERRQAIVQLLNIAQQVILDVKLRMREVLTSYQEMSKRADAERSAATALNAITLSEEARKDLGPEFLQLKLDAQQRLANARLDKLQAIFNYNVAIMHLEQAKGTLLEYDHIAIGSSPKESDENKGRFLDHTFYWDVPDEPKK